MAAKKLIQGLQDIDENSEPTDAIKNEIIQLGCQYGKSAQFNDVRQQFDDGCQFLGLASRYTSYVAVDPKEQKELKESWMMMKSRDVPVEFAHGWGGGYQTFGIGGGALGGYPMLGRSLGAPMALACNYSAPMQGIDLTLVCVISYSI